ncbi:MAG TPA: acyltransferase [Stellaceae bacterium]|nr:acyltransferase [Stellaceae bacterium]
MSGSAEPPRRGGPSSLAIDNLRAIVILFVLAFHSVLAYLNFLPPQPFPFDSPPFLWRAFPIVDSKRWVGFDLFCAWLDVYLMSFFFLLSGLFAWPSLLRRGALRFLGDRALRIGLPFLVVVALLMPVALYPTYLQTAADPGVAAYWRHWLALPLWPSGPMWFLWLLLAGDIAAAGLYRLVDGRREAVLRLSLFARSHSTKFLAAFVFLSAVAYIPLALSFGSSDWAQLGPFSFQLSRPLHYALYFFAGVAIGACGIERGLLAADAPLARRWPRWLIAAPVLLILWMALTSLTMVEAGGVSPALWALAHLSFVVACFANCFGMLALAIRFAGGRSPVFDSLKSNAYGMYLVHYVFVVWLQYALLAATLPAAVKAASVYGGTLLLSWSTIAALGRLRPVARIIGDGRRARHAGLRAPAVPEAIAD